jgi:hypothetical protein
MIQRKPQKKKRKGLTGKLPKLGRAGQLGLIVGVFLIIFVPTWLVYQQQPERQAELKTTLSNLERILAISQTPKEKLQTELNEAEGGLEVSRPVFPSINQSPEIGDKLLGLAKANDISVTGTKMSVSPRALSKDKGAIEWSVLTFEMNLKGQVPKFQNFILALDNEFPTCQVAGATFTTAEKEGEEDRATIKIEVFCYESKG